MFDKAKKYFKPALYIVGAVFWFLAVYSLYPALATYAPGETLDPPCSPGDAGCSVNAPLVTTLTTSTDMVMATYTLSFDTSTFYIDPVNDRVAVNTTTPLATFDVDGNMILSAASAYLNFNTTTGSGGYGIRDNDGTIQYRDGGGTWAAFSASTGTVNDGTLGSLAYYPANGTTVTGTTAAFLYWDDTNVRLGIGTTTPLATLHSESVTEQLRLGYDAANYASFIIDSAGSLTVSTSGGVVQIGDGGATNHALATNDDLVVTGQFEAIGSSFFEGDLTIANDLFIGGNVEVTGTIQVIDNFLVGGTSFAVDTESDRVGINTITPSAMLDIVSTTEQLRLAYDPSNYTSFTIGSDGALTVTSTNNVTTTINNSFIVGSNKLVVDYNSGQVGIGIANPAVGLHVGANATTHGSISTDDAIITGVLEVDGFAYFDNDLYVNTNTLYVDTFSGRIGFNTSTPAATMHAVSTTEQLRLGYDESNWVSFTVGSDGALAVTSTNNVTTTYNTSFIVNGGGPDILVVDYNSSKVGIGNSAPAVGLHVGNTGTKHGLTLGNDAIFSSNVEVSGIVYIESDLLVNTNTLYVDTTSDRVGFGTSSPAATLHAVSTTEQLRLGYDESNWTAFTVGADGALTVTSTNNVTTTYNTSFIVNGGGPDILVVDYNSSKVGIGNSAPAVGLHVGNTGTKHGLTLGNDAIFSSNVEVSGIVYIESDLLVNTNTLYVDTTSDRVGFGTSSPAATMHAVSTTEQLRLGYNENNYTSFTVGSDGALTITSTNNVTTTINNSFIAQGALTNVLVVDTNSGNVGIANEVPVVSLHVGGNATTHGLSGGGVIVSGALEVDGVSYFDDNVEISASLGVGTSTPSTTLQVLSTDTTQFTLAYDTTNFVNFNVSSTGALTIETMGSATTTFTNAVDISELYSGLITLPEDGGIVDVMDMPISTTPTGTAEAYNFLMDGLQVMSIWGQSDGTGQPSNTGITIGTTTIVTSSYKLFVAGSASTSAAIGVEGYVKATGFLTGSTSLDLAESYPIDPNCNETGSCPLADDVVCSVEKPNKTFVIEKCDVENADNVIGVVSRKPGFGLGRYNPMVYNPDESGLYPTEYLMIGLAGRVSVKVSTANGAIKSGDLLTSSAEAGVAVKSRGAGRVIGVALQSYGEAENGVIIVFINPHWAPGQMFEGMDQTDNDGVLDKFTIVVRNSLGKLGLVIKNGVALIKEIRTNKLCVGDTCVTETEFRRMLENSETLPAAPTTPGQSTEDTKIPDTNVDENDETSTTTDTEEDTTQEDSTTSASSTDEEANSESTESETQTTATEESSEVNESTDATETANTTVETATDTESTTETVETATVETVVTEPVVEEAVAIEESVVVEVVESTTATSNENVQ